MNINLIIIVVLWYNCLSPFILKYTDSVYKEVVDANKKNIEDKKKFLYAQPELKEPEFIKIMNEGMDKQNKNSRDRFIITWELCKYRLNKKIPNNLLFDERKKILINTPEWNGRIRMKNKHLSEDELTEENIQYEIDNAGILAGMELDMKFDVVRMQKAITDGYCELILDKGNVKYKYNI